MRFLKKMAGRGGGIKSHYKKIPGEFIYLFFFLISLSLSLKKSTFSSSRIVLISHGKVIYTLEGKIKNEVWQPDLLWLFFVVAHSAHWSTRVFELVPLAVSAIIFFLLFCSTNVECFTSYVVEDSLQNCTPKDFYQWKQCEGNWSVNLIV